MIVEHFDEYWLFGLFFAIVAGLQGLWGAWAYCNPLRRVLLIGALGNAALVAIWTISRISGLPFGPEAGQAESVGVVDVVATLDELAVVILVAAILRARVRVQAGSGRPVIPGRSRLAPALVSGLFSASLLAVMLGAHHH